VIKVTLASGQAGDAAILGQDPAADSAVIRAAGVSGATPAGSVQHPGCTVVGRRADHRPPARCGRPASASLWHAG
jgi:S1-C subfamily serine protease